MPCRIHILDRIIHYIRVPIQRLRVVYIRHNRIGLRKPPNVRIVIPRVVKHQRARRVILLSGERVIGWQRAFGCSHSIKRIVRLPRHQRAGCAIARDTR